MELACTSLAIVVDAIADIHVRSLRSEALLLPSKGDSVSGKKVQGRIHISSGGSFEGFRQQSAQRFTTAKRTRVKVPQPTLRNSTLPSCIFCIPLSRTNTKEAKKNSTRPQTTIEANWVPILPHRVQDLDRSTTHPGKHGKRAAKSNPVGDSHHWLRLHSRHRIFVARLSETLPCRHDRSPIPPPFPPQFPTSNLPWFSTHFTLIQAECCLERSDISPTIPTHLGLFPSSAAAIKSEHFTSLALPLHHTNVGKLRPIPFRASVYK
ncbi:hypothetical protein NA56DRAFT_704918 [Hyaloscypha hepaticicola]|uniref:Uncharacterized protein n=1 Tax=Hyaloscypha hepaticicola TaxID=2082293 RepID=A0A2J6Q1M9_9HELO|nr:hypothetical protein NA56DRAFT_704918 [Hyaloscypha hepaticicola]